MSNFNILIVEDEPLYSANLEMLVEELGYECSGVATNATAALQRIAATPPDLILMDIHLAGVKDGISLAEEINEQQTIPIIFITSMQDRSTYQRAKAIKPYAYLGKNFNEIDLQRTIELVVGKLQENDQQAATDWTQDILFKDCFFIKIKQQLVKVPFEHIHYIEVEQKYSTLYTQDKKYVVRLSLNGLLQKLPPNIFLRTHRNYLVNVAKIEAFDLADSVVYVAGQAIALSRKYKQQVLERMGNLL